MDWGLVYVGLTMDGNDAALPLNPRMPVIVLPGDYDEWLDGSIDDVMDFQFRDPLEPALFAIG